MLDRHRPRALRRAGGDHLRLADPRHGQVRGRRLTGGDDGPGRRTHPRAVGGGSVTSAPRETVLAATNDWFLRNGLSYFVPEQRGGGQEGTASGAHPPVAGADRAGRRSRGSRTGTGQLGIRLGPGHPGDDRDPGRPLVRPDRAQRPADRDLGALGPPSGACAPCCR